jgi:hypothetical protein
VEFGDITDTIVDETVRGDVAAGTVEDGVGEENLDRAVDVSNSGNSDDPDLVSFVLDVENDEVTFTFDELIAGGDAAVNELLFELQEIDGATQTSDSFVSTSGTDVTVGFPNVSDSTVAAFVDSDAVEANDDGNGNDADSATRALSFDAGDTLAPNLVSAEVTETTDVSGDVTAVAVEYTFDEDVDTVTADTFFGYNTDGTDVELDTLGDCDVSADDDTVVECEIDDPLELDALDDVVLATIENDAVEDAETFKSHPENAPVN